MAITVTVTVTVIIITINITMYYYYYMSLLLQYVRLPLLYRLHIIHVCRCMCIYIYIYIYIYIFFLNNTRKDHLVTNLCRSSGVFGSGVRPLLEHPGNIRAGGPLIEAILVDDDLPAAELSHVSEGAQKELRPMAKLLPALSEERHLHGVVRGLGEPQQRIVALEPRLELAADLEDVDEHLAVS